MASSGYTAITFVANEQPTTAKWNLIGSNDSSFNLGTGLEDSTIINRHYAPASISGDKILSYGTKRQNDTSNTTETAALVQTGWGVMAYSSSTVFETITFPTAFVGKPIVVATFGGDNPSNGAYGTGGNSVEGIVVGKAHTITNTSFIMQLHKSPTGTFASGYAYYQWIAIGV